MVTPNYLLPRWYLVRGMVSWWLDGRFHQEPLIHTDELCHPSCSCTYSYIQLKVAGTNM